MNGKYLFYYFGFLPPPASNMGERWDRSYILPLKTIFLKHRMVNITLPFNLMERVPRL